MAKQKKYKWKEMAKKIYIYIERENSISRYKLYAKTIRSITYKVIK